MNAIFWVFVTFYSKKKFERNKYTVLWPKKRPQSSNSLINAMYGRVKGLS